MKKNIPVIVAGLILLTACSGTRPDLGLNNGELMPCPKTPNCVNSQAADTEHYIKPIHFTGTQQEAHANLLRILESEKRTKILTVQKNYIRVEFTSAVFRFVDDVEFYFPEQQADEQIIHVRSASRIGSSDLGVNRKRVEQIRNTFKAINKE
jgi:uncharacterized protein (DUF1499 family)